MFDLIIAGGPPSEKSRYMPKGGGNFFVSARRSVCLAHFLRMVERERMRRSQESIAGRNLLESMKKNKEDVATRIQLLPCSCICCGYRLVEIRVQNY